ncbi:MAG: pyridoxal-phosphate dependent enzyme [Chloroflexota bacterium]|nr:pyridoxal-phosphate dependent enzyme [Chloroflexota bacterium]
MASVRSLRCPRCDAGFEPEEQRFGCPRCASDVGVNLEVEYDGRVAPARVAPQGAPRGLWRWADALPLPAGSAISLGEGATPLLALARLGAEIGLDLRGKNESVEPTWSFKDRLATVAISWARARGIRGIATSSSGNAGAAAAAYAAKAGLPCVVFTTRAFPGTMQRFMRSYGAMVVATPTAPDRWTLNRVVASEWGWMAISNVVDPPVGSHPIAVEGCKTIAYEIAEDLGWKAPDAVVVPVAYGDALSGIARGFAELHAAGLVARVPRLIAVEAYPTLSRALAEDAEAPVRVEATGSRAYSVATPRGTWQALRAIRSTQGTAVAVSDDEALAAQKDLREREGLLLELSAAMPLAAVRRLARSGGLSRSDTVVLLLTSSGLKDLEVTDTRGELPLAEPRLDDLRRVLKESYGFAA